jgi:hypothetical protein
VTAVRNLALLVRVCFFFVLSLLVCSFIALLFLDEEEIEIAKLKV